MQNKTFPQPAYFPSSLYIGIVAFYIPPNEIIAEIHQKDLLEKQIV